MSENLDRVLRPSSIAVVGASPDGTKFGGKLMNLLGRIGYQGKVLPINPNYNDLNGIPCYPSIAAVPPKQEIDLVLISVPRERVSAILLEAAARKTAGAVVFTSGFAEAGASGKRLEAELAKIARENRIRLLGPNSFGFVNFVDRVAASPAAALHHGEIVAGNVGLVSHSGGVALGSIYALARDRGINFSHVVCPGNEADLDVCEVIDFLVEDPATKVIAAVLEGVNDGPRLVRSLSRARAAHKPVIVLKVGRSEVGREAALSHTGHLAGVDGIFDAVARQCGVIRVDDIDELYLQAGLMAHTTVAQRQTLSQRAGLAIISISGGIGAILSDSAGVAGVSLAPLTDQTKTRLERLLPSFQTASNPFDVGAVALTNPGVILESIKSLSEDPSVGVVVPALTVAKNYDSVLEQIVRIDASIPIVALWAGRSYAGAGAAILARAGFPYFDTPTALVRALSRLIWYCQAAYGRTLPSSKDRSSSVKVVAPPAVSGPARSLLSEHEGKAWLSELGFPVVEGKLARSEDEAVAIAESLGYPVVLKLVSAHLVHKSEHGAVLLDQRSADAVCAGYSQLCRVGADLGSRDVRVERMVVGATEAIVSLKTDPQFGPVLMVGGGGIFVELLKDVAFLMPPIDEADIEAAIERTAVLKPFLRGFRNSPPKDRTALVRFIHRLAEMAPALCGIADEIELNPVLVCRDGEGVLIADAVVRLRRSQENGETSSKRHIREINLLGG